LFLYLAQSGWLFEPEPRVMKLAFGTRFETAFLTSSAAAATFAIGKNKGRYKKNRFLGDYEGIALK
jgi:hypothetical protein